MARRWWKSGHLAPGTVVKEPGSILTHDARWKLKLAINGVGAVATFIVMLVFAITKFREGAWIIILLVPTLVTIFFAIHHHYRDLAKRLSLEEYRPAPRVTRHRVIIPISGVHRGTLAAMRYARGSIFAWSAVFAASSDNWRSGMPRRWARGRCSMSTSSHSISAHFATASGFSPSCAGLRCLSLIHI